MTVVTLNFTALSTEHYEPLSDLDFKIASGGSTPVEPLQWNILFE